MSQLYRFCISLNHHHLSFPSSLFSALLPFSIAFSAGPLQNWYLHSPDDYNRDYSFLFQFLASRKLFEQINRARILDRVTGMRGREGGSNSIWTHFHAFNVCYWKSYAPWFNRSWLCFTAKLKSFEDTKIARDENGRCFFFSSYFSRLFLCFFLFVIVESFQISRISDRLINFAAKQIWKRIATRAIKFVFFEPKVKETKGEDWFSDFYHSV